MRRFSLKVNEEDERIKELGKSFFLYEKAFEEISAEDAESFIANNSSLITIIDNVPNGVSIVTPDYKVEQKENKDNQYEKAISLLK